MNKKSKTLLLIIILAILLTAAVFAYQSLSAKVSPNVDLEKPNITEPSVRSTEQPSKEKMKAPNFTVADVNGKPISFSEMVGKPIVLNFWASWCPPCKQEMPEFNQVFQELGDKVIFMMVNMTDGQRETIETASNYVKKQGFSFPVYFDTEQSAAIAYGIRSYPTTIFIDKDGYVATGAEGMIDESVLRKGIDLILG